MKTDLSPTYQNTAHGKRAGDIIRNCVHCGFCNAVCPTYQLLGDELDGPRGRIYQMKGLFEGVEGGEALRLHLDRCLLCRACEPACPSGVQYGELVEISRMQLDAKQPRRPLDAAWRRLLTRALMQPRIFASLLRIGRSLRRLLPPVLARKIPPARAKGHLSWPKAVGPQHSRKVLALAGCVQSAIAPHTNLAAANVLDRLGIAMVEIAGAGCCGGLALHTTTAADAKAAARELLDKWIPHLDEAEAIVMTASGCGVTLHDYPRLFADEPEYLEAAKRVATMTVDLCELVARELPADYAPAGGGKRVAFHAPCTLQHGQRVRGVVEDILQRAGHTLVAVKDAHLCCGSAGTYSMLQPKISGQLQRAKQDALLADSPDVICTANIGCQVQIAGGAVPVVHWVELLL